MAEHNFKDMARKVMQCDGGDVCPFCRHEAVEDGDIKLEEVSAYRSVVCQQCGRKWCEVWLLDGVSFDDDKENGFIYREDVEDMPDES